MDFLTATSLKLNPQTLTEANQQPTLARFGYSMKDVRSTLLLIKLTLFPERWTVKMLVASRQCVKNEMPQVNVDHDFSLTLREMMRFEKNRLDSFPSQWLNHHHLDVNVVKRLTKAGFYYKPIGGTQCFSCGWSKPVSFWLEEHDPETVHSKRRSTCEFVQGQSQNVPLEQHYIVQTQSISGAARPEKPPRAKVENLKQLDISGTNHDNRNYSHDEQSVGEVDSNPGEISQEKETGTRTIPRRPPAPRKVDHKQNSTEEPTRDNIATAAISGSADAALDLQGNATMREERVTSAAGTTQNAATPAGGNTTKSNSSGTIRKGKVF